MDLLKEKIKHKPEDFIVEEVLPLETSPKGKYGYYLLKKRGRNTLDALSEVSSRLNIPLHKFGFAGLKDKRAITVQHISIEGGPKAFLKGKGWELEYIGRGERGIEIGDAKGNIFTVTIRNIDPGRVIYNLELIKEIGFANYFGEQRFLSDINTKRPIALYLLEGRYEEALREYFTQSNNPYFQRKLKKLWGNWRALLEELKNLSIQERRVLMVLSRTRDPAKAFRAFPKNLKLMFFFSYQSLLWNRCLSRILSKAPHKRIPFIKKEKLVFHTKITAEIEELMEKDIPYISRESVERGPYRELLRNVVSEEGIESYLDREVEGLKVFNEGARRAIVKPERLDILYETRNSLTVRFFLPSGSYATVLLRKAVFL